MKSVRVPHTRSKSIAVAASGCLAAIAMLLVAAKPAGARTIYAAPGGAAGTGTEASPFTNLQAAVDTLKPGDTLLLNAGVYRQSATVRTLGTAAMPISIRPRPGANVVITGADRLRDGWTKVQPPTPASGPGSIYSHAWDHVFPIDYRSDGTPVLTHPEDQEHMVTGRAEQVFDSGFLLRQVLTERQLSPGTFYVDLGTKNLFVWLRSGDDPKDHDLEASVRDTWIRGSNSSSGISVRGITFRYAANFAQRGAFVLDNTTRGWAVSDCVFEWANGPGVSMSGDHHVFTRCTFQDNGQLGFGAGGANDCQVVRSNVLRNNWKGYSTGWEAGGLKVAESRGFTFDHCLVSANHGSGIWFDIGNEKSEVSHCLVTNNDDSGIFYEISYGLYAHDNVFVNNGNRTESVGGDWGVTAGITLSSSQNCVIDHNTFVGNRDGIDFREANRTTPRIGAPNGAKEERIWNQNHKITNNVFANSQTYSIGFWYDMPFFNNPPDTTSPTADPKTLGYVFSGNLLWPAPSKPNFLYGAEWKARSKKFDSPAEFSKASGIPDTDIVADPHFKDPLAGDYTVTRQGMKAIVGAGARSEK